MKSMLHYVELKGYKTVEDCCIKIPIIDTPDIQSYFIITFLKVVKEKWMNVDTVKKKLNLDICVRNVMKLNSY